MDKVFILMCIIVTIGLIIPVIYFGVLFKKYGNRLPSFWLGLPVISVYLFLFSWLAPKMIPDSWLPEAYQVKECKVVTKYKEKD